MSRKSQQTAKMFSPEALEALREVVPAKSSFTDASHGVWTGGRVYENAFGEAFFLPLGAKRADIPVRESLRLVGDGVKNTRGFGEVRLTNALADEVANV